MLWTIFVILLILWLLGFSFHIAGGLIHILLVIAHSTPRGRAGSALSHRAPADQSGSSESTSPSPPLPRRRPGSRRRRHRQPAERGRRWRRSCAAGCRAAGARAAESESGLVGSRRECPHRDATGAHPRRQIGR